MAGFLSKIARFASSPQGRSAIDKARVKAEQMSKDPATRAKIDKGVGKVRSEVDRRRGGGNRSAAAGGSPTPPPPTTPPTSTPPTSTPPARTPPTSTPPTGS